MGLKIHPLILHGATRLCYFADFELMPTVTLFESSPAHAAMFCLYSEWSSIHNWIASFSCAMMCDGCCPQLWVEWQQQCEATLGESSPWRAGGVTWQWRRVHVVATPVQGQGTMLDWMPVQTCGWSWMTPPMKTLDSSSTFPLDNLQRLPLITEYSSFLLHFLSFHH